MGTGYGPACIKRQVVAIRPSTVAYRYLVKPRRLCADGPDAADERDTAVAIRGATHDKGIVSRDDHRRTKLARSSASKSIIRSEFLSSRAPIGSSASTTVGLETRARAMPTR